ncbi:MAG: rRNA maturation RNase YbeY [Pseudomonadota bacterium]
MAEPNPPAAPIVLAIAIRDRRWREALPEVRTVVRRAAAEALAVEGFAAGGEISFALVGDAEIRRLNRDYRRKDRPTNVLAFPGEAPGRRNGAPGLLGPALLGDVVIALETVTAEARAQAKSLADHLSHLVVHGVLHLLGYDHGAAKAANAMEARERCVLARLGIADPYVAAGSAAAEGVR